MILFISVIIILYFKHKFGMKALPDHLRYKIHNDYIFPLCLIPRSLTAYKLSQPPRLLCGYNINDWFELNGKDAPHPIQRHLNGKFISCQLCWPLFFSISFKWGWYFIIGCRFDAVDYYYNFPTVDISFISRFEE